MTHLGGASEGAEKSGLHRTEHVRQAIDLARSSVRRRLRHEDARHFGWRSLVLLSPQQCLVAESYHHTNHPRFKPQILVQNQTLHDVTSQWFFDGKNEGLHDVCAVNVKSTERNPQFL